MVVLVDAFILDKSATGNELDKQRVTLRNFVLPYLYFCEAVDHGPRSRILDIIAIIDEMLPWLRNFFYNEGVHRK